MNTLDPLNYQYRQFKMFQNLGVDPLYMVLWSFQERSGGWMIISDDWLEHLEPLLDIFDWYECNFYLTNQNNMSCMILNSTSTVHIRPEVIYIWSFQVYRKVVVDDWLEVTIDSSIWRLCSTNLADLNVVLRSEIKTTCLVWFQTVLLTSRSDQKWYRYGTLKFAENEWGMTD